MANDVGLRDRDLDPTIDDALSGGRAREFYGFIALVLTSIFWVVFLIWAFFPDSWLIAMGIEWYPSREWAILLPSYSIVIVLLTYWTYFALAVSATPSFSDLAAFTDEYAQIPPIRDNEPNPYLAYASPDAIPELYDIPIGIVNAVLYDTKRKDE